MTDGLRDRLRLPFSRVRQFLAGERRAALRWLEHTSNLRHVSILVFVPTLIGVVTYLSNALHAASFLIFPPLASGTYTLFAEPQGRYSSPVRFVGGMTTGALSGWVALELSARFWYGIPPGGFQVHAGAAALGILLTGLVTWRLKLEAPSAFSTALLVLIFTGNRTITVFDVPVSFGLVYVFGVAVSSTLVAAVFVLWREGFYEERAKYLYETTRSDDHVLVPMRGDDPETVSMFGAQIAGAHEAGKVVLLDVVENEAVAEREQELLDRLVGFEGKWAGDGSGEGGPDLQAAGAEPERMAPSQLDDAGGSEGSTTAESAFDGAADSVARLEEQASYLETKVGVPVDVIVAVADGNHAHAVLQTARETNSDLIVVPYETRYGSLSPFVRTLFRGNVDVIALRPRAARERWRDIMVPVRGAGDQAHAMIDFALRLTGRVGRVSVCHCLSQSGRRRRAEDMLAQLVESFAGRFETRVAEQEITEFISENAPHYDLTILGASTDRSVASRFISRPTFERLEDVDCDVAIVHRAR